MFTQFIAKSVSLNEDDVEEILKGLVGDTSDDVRLEPVDVDVYETVVYWTEDWEADTAEELYTMRLAHMLECGLSSIRVVVEDAYGDDEPDEFVMTLKDLETELLTQINKRLEYSWLDGFDPDFAPEVGIAEYLYEDGYNELLLNLGEALA